MQMIMQMNPGLAQRFSLLGGGGEDQGVLARPAPQPPAGGGGLGGALNKVFTGSRERDPNALLQAGLAAIVANERPGATVLGTLARGASAGQSAGLSNRDKAAMQEIIAQGGPQALQQLFLQAVGSGNIEAAKVLQQTMQTMQAGASSAATAGRPFVVDGQLVTPAGEVLLAKLPEDADLTDTMNDVLFLLGVDPENPTPEEQSLAQSLLMQMKRASATQISTSIGGAQNAAAAAVGAGFAAGFDTTGVFLNSMPRINRALEITDDPAFKRVTGVFSSAQQIAERLKDTPQSRHATRLAQEYLTLTGEQGLRIVGTFKGAMSERELAVAFKLGQADMDLSPAELNAGLHILRRAGIYDAMAWAEGVLRAGPDAVGGDNFAWKEFKSRADAAVRAFREEIKYMQSEGVDVPAEDLFRGVG